LAPGRADLGDYDSLLAMARKAKVVLTYVGPYEEFGGEHLIRAALDACTHYVDITGETPWKLDMLGRYEKEAQDRGVVVVQSAGLDSLPADLAASLAAESLASDDEGPPTEVAVMWEKLNGWVSAGTLHSGMYSATHHAPTNDYSLAPGMKQTPKWAAQFLFPELHLPYPMSFVDTPTLVRSMHLMFPKASVSVTEDMAPSVAAHFAVFAADPRMVLDSPIVSTALGKGPPEWMMAKGSFALEGRARRAASGRVAGVRVEGRGDPGYGACAKYSVELALGLAQPGGAAGAGFLTPALALGPRKLRQRLEAAEHGRLFRFETYFVG